MKGLYGKVTEIWFGRHVHYLLSTSCVKKSSFYIALNISFSVPLKKEINKGFSWVYYVRIFIFWANHPFKDSSV